MTVTLKLSGFMVDKPQTRTIKLDPEADAVQLPDGTIKKVKELKKEALDQYFYEKYIKNSNIEGRILSIDFSK